jgi:myo-inositol-1(or 4)-monophosphatase
MSDTAIHERLTAGLAATRRAGRLAAELFAGRDKLVVERKGRQDLVSRADREVEELLRQDLGGSFPGDDFLGEEGGGESAPSLWVIDPIDGTSNFLQGIPFWGILLAYVRDGVTEIGITHDPVRDETWWAVRGGGAFRDGERIRCSTVTDPSEAILSLSFSFKQDPENYLSMLRRATAMGIDHRRIGSSAIKLAYVADGRFDAMVSMLTNSWDVLPGLLLVEEAGGVTSGFGDDLLQPRAIAASAPGIGATIAEVSGLQMVGLRRPG